MQTRSRVVVSFLVALGALLAASAPAPVAAAPKRITGKLSKPGYTVIALAANGKARSAVAKSGRFRLKPPAKVVTLHLRAKDGTYAGPIVVGAEGKRAILGVGAGADLGRISVRNGYAKVTKTLPEKSFHPSRWARAKNGVPIGARVFGRVKSRSRPGEVPADRDLDGVPDALDIDDDGDLILDDLDRSAGSATQGGTFGRVRSRPPARAAQGQELDSSFTSDLTLDLAQTVNANPRHSGDPTQPAFTDEQIDAALASPGGRLFFGGLPPGASVELDCGRDDPTTPQREGLSYCSSGNPPSTGRVNTALFPDCCDPDGDGYGTLPGLAKPRDLTHGATAAQVKTGDVVIKHFTTGGDESQCPPPPATSNPACNSITSTLQYVFATVPALTSYDDDGPGGKETTTLPYPNQAGGGGIFPVSAPPGQDVVVKLTFWKPQRRRIANDPQPKPGESATWTDIGGLNYTASSAGAPTTPPQPGRNCPQSAFSDPRSEPTPNQLTPLSSPLPEDAGGFKDEASDQPASVANKLTYTLNLTQCLTSPWNVGETRRFHFKVSPPSGGGFAQQIVQFKRQ